MGRHLDWEGTFNARDLGGLPTRDGRRTAWGAVVRSDTLDRLSPAGWAGLHDHGIRTVVDLRSREEREQRSYETPEGIDRLALPLEEGLEDDSDFRHWTATGILATPLYYRTFLARWPERVAAAVSAVAQAREGGVVVHCTFGRDRAGLVALLLLGLAGVSADDIAEDHGISQLRLRKHGPALGYSDDSIWVEALLEGERTTGRDVIVDLMGALDVDAYLKEAGVGDADSTLLRERLVLPSG